MNITELLVDLHTLEREATARADELCQQIAHFTAALTESEARLTDLATTRKIITELAPAGTEPDPPESSSAYQTIVDAFNQHPGQAFGPVSCPNSSTCPPTKHPSTPPAAASDDSPAKVSSPNPDEAATRNGLNAHSVVRQSEASPHGPRRRD
ncbi:hypothetical protein [Streptomyces sp. NPDC007355]|uniref:hypothetical protein n=1 Tax=Streptomyces sp. NPDC007355 TaxID=3364778 RepID=UPI0036785207